MIEACGVPFPRSAGFLSVYIICVASAEGRKRVYHSMYASGPFGQYSGAAPPPNTGAICLGRVKITFTRPALVPMYVSSAKTQKIIKPAQIRTLYTRSLSLLIVKYNHGVETIFPARARASGNSLHNIVILPTVGQRARLEVELVVYVKAVKRQPSCRYF